MSCQVWRARPYPGLVGYSAVTEALSLSHPCCYASTTSLLYLGMLLVQLPRRFWPTRRPPPASCFPFASSSRPIDMCQVFKGPRCLFFPYQKLVPTSSSNSIDLTAANILMASKKSIQYLFPRVCYNGIGMFYVMFNADCVREFGLISWVVSRYILNHDVGNYWLSSRFRYHWELVSYLKKVDTPSSCMSACMEKEARPRHWRTSR